MRSKSKEKKYGTGIFIMFVSGSAASTESRNGSYRTGFSRMLSFISLGPLKDSRKPVVYDNDPF